MSQFESNGSKYHYDPYTPTCATYRVPFIPSQVRYVFCYVMTGEYRSAPWRRYRRNVAIAMFMCHISASYFFLYVRRYIVRKAFHDMFRYLDRRSVNGWGENIKGNHTLGSAAIRILQVVGEHGTSALLCFINKRLLVIEESNENVIACLKI